MCIKTEETVKTGEEEIQLWTLMQIEEKKSAEKTEHDVSNLELIISHSCPISLFQDWVAAVRVR